MARTFALHDVVEFVTLPATGRTWVVTELDPYGDSCSDEGGPLVRVWPTDPGDVRVGQWVGANLLRLSDHCPQHCPRCGIDLKAEGYPQGHQNDDGDVCEWSWDLRQAVADDQDRARPCADGCGLAAESGDVFCPGCREGHERNRTNDDPDRLGGP